MEQGEAGIPPSFLVMWIIRRQVSVLLFLMLPGMAIAEQPEAPSAGSPICIWDIYVTLLNHAEICKLDVVSDMHAAMEETVAELHRFIADNSEIARHP